MPSFHELNPKNTDAKADQKRSKQFNRKDEKNDEAVLTFLIQYRRLPEYLVLLTEKPEGASCEEKPSPVAEQAKKEWPNVAMQWSLPTGDFLGYWQGGVIVGIGEKIVFFDLEQLWRTIGLMPCTK